MNETPNALSPMPDRQTLAIDNLIRRELKVGDPRDPQAIAQALADRYQSDVRAQAIEGEAQGMPFLRTAVVRPSAPPPLAATNIDLNQARHDVETDMARLLDDNQSKDIRPELEGWQQVIVRSIDEGVAAARMSMDTRQRDKAFAMRRQLGDYARLARMIGVLTPDLNRSFRDLGQSLDEVSAVILVLMGEALANLGFAGGHFLLQAPFTELQARRDAVLNALRQVDGVAAMVGQGSTWPRGLQSYRQLAAMLEARGQGDLRSLLGEGELARTMDEVVQLASGGGSSGLRAIGATAWGPLARLNRFVQSTLGQIPNVSPELATLLEALQLFIDGFMPAGGFRLLRVARPSVLNYGLYGPSPITPAENRLMNVVNHRGTLARQLDCLTDCACDHDTVLAQIVLDKLLYDIDRSIDFYCVGDADLGLPEARAAAYSFLIDVIVASNPINASAQAREPFFGPMWPFRGNLQRPRAFCSTGTVVAGVAGVIPDAVINELDAIRRLLRPLDANYWSVTTTVASFQNIVQNNLSFMGGAPSALRFVDVMHEELCLQRDSDLQWRPLVEQMTIGCVSVEEIFDSSTTGPEGILPLFIDRALDLFREATGGGVPASCTPLDPRIPPHFEQTLFDRL
ncbi:hypothetical protein [Caballeronia sp. SL2Y3]|uniref:hypothetical protein n=1 Tax=Caballeronia sp. SL2Y3 TaxID=2878151 RepID=UPI001FD563FF|nr:hypothetical protein [Caballeronia sp. SL2Y3]